MKKVTDKQCAVALYEATKGESEKKIDEILQKFIDFLIKKQKMRRVENIITEFIKYNKIQDGQKDVEIISARKLVDSTVNKISLCFGKNSETKCFINEDLLGGIIVKTDDKIFDASLRTHLNRISNIT
jgi:F-type H+-transporting ATPase subunit delta